LSKRRRYNKISWLRLRPDEEALLDWLCAEILAREQHPERLRELIRAECRTRAIEARDDIAALIETGLAAYEAQIYTVIVALLTPEMQERLDALLVSQPVVEGEEEEALQLYRKAGNELGVAATLIESAIPIWWFSLVDATTLQTIRHRLQEGQAIVTRLGSRYWIGFCSWLAALVALSEGETARADQLAQESLAIWQEIGNPWLIAWALHALGRVEAQQGDMPLGCASVGSSRSAA
jgi:hypothetical protein